MKRFFLPAALALIFAVRSSCAPDDQKIEEAAEASYNYRTVLEGHVTIHVHDGVARLTGTVEDSDQKDLAEETVKNLPGVVRVDDRIKVVATSPDHSDGWIALKIRGKLMVKANVSASTTTVDVTGGVVHLTGTALDTAQRDLTAGYAKEVDGVKAVKNDITIRDGKSDPAAGRTIGESIDDASITTQVKFALATHKFASAVSTKVSTVDGNVLLTGDAPSQTEKDLATRLANEVRGVKKVNNQMNISP